MVYPGVVPTNYTAAKCLPLSEPVISYFGKCCDKSLNVAFIITVVLIFKN